MSGRVKKVLMIILAAVLFMTIGGGAAFGANVIQVPGRDINSGQKIKPAAPSELKVTNFPGVLPVCLSWKDNSLNETGFTIERYENSTGFQEVGSVNAGVNTYVDSSVSKDMIYRYRVYAIGSLVDSDYSNEVEWITLPNNPGPLQGRIDGFHGWAELQWEGNNTYASYMLSKTTKKADKTSMIQTINLDVGSDTYHDKDIKPGCTYTYFITAVSKAGWSEHSNQITMPYLQAPSKVTVLCFPGAPKLQVRWEDNTDNELKFVVEKAYSSTGNIFSYDVPANTTSFEDNVITNYFYMYRVKAVGPDGGESPYSENGYWYAPPNKPNNFIAQAVSSTEVLLSWQDCSQYETGFKIWRTGENVISPIDVGANVTSYSDKNLKPGTTYSYTINAITESGTISADLPPAKVETPADSNFTKIELAFGGKLPADFELDTVLEVGSPQMFLNGVPQEIDPGKGTAPVIVGGRTLIPIGAIIAAYQGTVQWDGAESKVTIVCNGKTVELWINSTTARVNGEDKTIDVAPQILNERTMMPLAFISENLGLSVVWNPATSQVTIGTGK